jgi:hypothetical protein
MRARVYPMRAADGPGPAGRDIWRGILAVRNLQDYRGPNTGVRSSGRK